MRFEKPPEVREAMLRKNKKALQNMQRKSVESAKINRAEKKERAEINLLEAALHEAQLNNDSVAMAHYDELLRHSRGELS